MELIGQERGALVQHLVLEGSMDARMAKRLVEKQEVQDRALDGVRPGIGVPEKKRSFWGFWK